ncbi:MAG: sulfurtransferase [Candidatus Thiodiazotropha sp. (ex Monitilora ramsayi)]|nr:sulfurtransferase [Candidatus Thiodiazotropha sp. (ex Monitilora ramsayi)]
MADLPLLIEPEALKPLLDRADLLVLDLCKDTTYQQLHLPGALHMPYAEIVASRHPTHGLLPLPDKLAQLFSAYGIGDTTHVVAYDDEGGGNACRLLWTLDAMGHSTYSLLNGGLHAWANEHHPVTRDKSSPQPTDFTPRPNPAPVAETADILQSLHREDLALWDARSVNEYQGLSRFSQYPGHIPGAVNLDWLELMDREHNLRLKPEETLREMLGDLGITPDKDVITYCQTHHRSSLSWFVLKYLGYERARGYPGSWSDWGNRDDTPKETP